MFQPRFHSIQAAARQRVSIVMDDLKLFFLVMSTQLVSEVLFMRSRSKLKALK